MGPWENSVGTIVQRAENDNPAITQKHFRCFLPGATAHSGFINTALLAQHNIDRDNNIIHIPLNNFGVVTDYVLHLDHPKVKNIITKVQEFRNTLKEGQRDNIGQRDKIAKAIMAEIYKEYPVPPQIVLDANEENTLREGRASHPLHETQNAACKQHMALFCAIAAYTFPEQEFYGCVGISSKLPSSRNGHAWIMYENSSELVVLEPTLQDQKHLIRPQDPAMKITLKEALAGYSYIEGGALSAYNTGQGYSATMQALIEGRLNVIQDDKLSYEDKWMALLQKREALPAGERYAGMERASARDMMTMAQLLSYQKWERNSATLGDFLPPEKPDKDFVASPTAWCSLAEYFRDEKKNPTGECELNGEERLQLSAASNVVKYALGAAVSMAEDLFTKVRKNGNKEEKITITLKHDADKYSVTSIRSGDAIAAPDWSGIRYVQR